MIIVVGSPRVVLIGNYDPILDPPRAAHKEAVSCQ